MQCGVLDGILEQKESRENWRNLNQWWHLVNSNILMLDFSHDKYTILM